MAKAILSYSVENNLSEFIQQRAKGTGKTLNYVENDLAKYCGLKIRKNKYGEVAEAVKKIKSNYVDPALPLAMKICEYFGCKMEDMYTLKEV